MPGLAATCCTQAGHSTLALGLMDELPPVARNVVTHRLPPLVSLLPTTLMGDAGSLRARAAAPLGPHAGPPPAAGRCARWAPLGAAAGAGPCHCEHKRALAVMQRSSP